MLEKNKDYVEFTLQCTSVEGVKMRRGGIDCNVCFNGYSDADFPCVPMDVVCKEFGHKVVMMSKSDFEKLQADDQHYRKMAKQLDQEVKILNGALQEWKEGTGCPSPAGAKSIIESAISWHDAYNEVVEKKRKLTDEVESWKHVTGYSTPEGFLAAKINDLGNDYISWKMVTGCSCPKDLSKKIVEWEEILTPHMSARDLCSAMSNVIDFDKRKEREIESAIEALRKLNLAIQKELESNIDEWQKATGCSTPEEAETTMRYLRGKIDEMKEFASIASNWTDRIVED